MVTSCRSYTDTVLVINIINQFLVVLPAHRPGSQPPPPAAPGQPVLMNRDGNMYHNNGNMYYYGYPPQPGYYAAYPPPSPGPYPGYPPPGNACYYVIWHPAMFCYQITSVSVMLQTYRYNKLNNL